MMDSVKKAFVLSVKALKLFYLIVAVNIVTNIVNVLLIPVPGDTELTLEKSFSVIGISLLFVLISVFIYGGALAYVKELIKTGASSLASFVDNAKKYFLRLLAVGIILLSIFAIVGIIFAVILGVLPGTIAKILFGILGAIVFIMLTVLFVMPGYALVGSELGVVESIKKGVSLGKNNFFKILGVLVIMVLAGIAIMLVASILSGILSLILRPAAQFIASIVMAIANTILALWLHIAYMDIYLKS